ncbi:glycosyltransferase [Curtobacterium sp. MCBD17_040]|uniref:glycosyltransferase n=1 Tax=Curtobacterium sp. MCBD17_040 TaxID=2175674 RepID=UPI0024DFD1AA|nr:glycosyltransferase [Curtobacterium sp. MCBD17_040]WIB65751.1 glycosyltransferase [Curtobacterium sp. MCBD17_040]
MCSFVGGAGHLVPQLPLHRALADAGHDLTLVGRTSAISAAPTGLYRNVAARADRRSGPSGGIAPLAPLDVEHELEVIEHHFAGAAALRSASAVRELLPGADLLVCDELDLGAIAAAQHAGVPSVVVAVIASGALVRPTRLVQALGRLGDELGLSGPVRPHGNRFVVPFAPRMRDPLFPAPANALWMRPSIGTSPASNGSVVATLGTEFNTESGDLFDRILAALALLDAPAVLAVGNDVNPGRFGPQPERIRVERFVDLDALIPRAGAVVHHGGSGLFLHSVLGGAAQVVLPMGADQPFTGQRVDDLGLGVTLNPISVTPSEIAAAITRVGADVGARERTAALRAATLRLPAPADVVAEIQASLL